MLSFPAAIKVYLGSIFGGHAASFSYNGDSIVHGRLIAEFGYRVGIEDSRYTFLFGNGRVQHVTAAQDGKFFIDPKTLDLVSLFVRTSQLPPETATCEVTQTLDYDGRVLLNGLDFLLPSETRSSVIHADGSEVENHTLYSTCHEFHSESALRFEPPPEAGPATAHQDRQAPRLTIPPGLPFKLIFTEPINTAVAAAGDRIKAKVVTAIRDDSFKVLVPEGSLVTGRIIKIQRFYGPPAEVQNVGRQHNFLVIGVKLETLDVGGGMPQPFIAKFDSGARRFAKVTGFASRRVDLGRLDTSEDPDVAKDPGVANFEFRDVNPNFVVKSGLESNWLTLAP